jgi:acyl-CoA thioester hydrolase
MKQHQTKIQLRFSDFDVLRHVNNAKYATFMENARIDFFQDVIAPHHDWKEVGILIARLEFDFKIPVLMTDELIVLSHVSAIGTKSLTFDHQFTVNGDSGILLKATGSSVAVCYDYARNNSMVVPPLWRQRINEYQGTEL